MLQPCVCVSYHMLWTTLPFPLPLTQKMFIKSYEEASQKQQLLNWTRFSVGEERDKTHNTFSGRTTDVAGNNLQVVNTATADTI